jgi:hypothetical protein
MKNKKTQTVTDKTLEAAQQAGLLLMSAAVTLGMLEPSDHLGRQVVLPNQPAFALARINDDLNNPLRRESEETAPHYVSYSEGQRTPARSGRQ